MPSITPFMWFVDNAEEAANYYVSVFKNSKIDDVRRYGKAGPGPEGAAMVIEFQLNGQDFMALNGFHPAPNSHKVAFFVTCETQDEVDRLWDALTKDGEPGQCGWLIDKYGFSWNLVPEGMGEILHQDDPEKSERAMRAMLQMEKLDLNELRRAAEAV